MTTNVVEFRNRRLDEITEEILKHAQNGRYWKRWEERVLDLCKTASK